MVAQQSHKNTENYTARLPFGSTKKRKVATKTIPYERYREILFQKVASGYLLHFVQDGSSKNAPDVVCFAQKCRKSKIGRKTSVYIPPLTPDRPPLKGGRYVIRFHSVI